VSKQNSLTLPNAPYRCKLSVKALKWSYYLPTRISCNSLKKLNHTPMNGHFWYQVVFK